MLGSGQTIYVNFDGRAAAIERKLQQIENKTKSSAKRMEGMFKNALNKAAQFAAIYVGFRGMEKALSELVSFDKGMRNVNTILKLSESDFKKMGEGVRDLQVELGASGEELTEGLYQAASAGVQAADVLIFLKTATKAAKAGLTDTKVSVDGLTSVLNAFHMQTSEANKVADIMFTTVRLGKTTFEEMASSIAEFAPLSASLGISFTEDAAALATMTKQGVLTKEAATQLNAIFTAVLKSQDEARKMGPKVAEAFSIEALKAKGLQQYLVDLNTVLGGNQEQMVKLFGRTEAVKGMLQLVGQNARMAASDLDEMTKSAGEMGRAFDEQTKSIDFKINKLNASITVLAASIIDNFAPALTWLVENFTQGLDKITGRWADAQEKILAESYKGKGAIEGWMEAFTGYDSDDLKRELDSMVKEWEGLDEKLTKAEREKPSSLAGNAALKEEIELLKEKKMMLEAQAEAIKRILSPVPVTETAPTVTTVTTKELTEEEKKKILEALKAKEEAIKKYYDEIKWLDEDYYKYRVDMIDKEVNEISKKVSKEFDLEKMKNKMISDLDRERAEFFVRPEIISDEDWSKIDEAIIEWSNNLDDEFSNALIDSFDKGIEKQNALHEDMLSSASEFGYALTNAFGGSGKSFLSWLNMALQAAIRISDIVDKMNAGEKSGASGGLGIITTILSFIPGLSKGGSVVNYGGNVSYTRIPKFASGVSSFTVPPGYPGDSFPIMVESGERVTVTPAAATRDQNGLADIKGYLEAMVIAINKQKRPVVFIEQKTPGIEFVQKTVQKEINSMSRHGVKLDEF